MDGDHVQVITPIWYPISHVYPQLHKQSSQAPTVLAGEKENLL